MIPDSDKMAIEIVQSVLQDDEQLIWAGRPCLHLSLLDEVPLLLLWVGIFGLFLAALGYFHLDPSFDWKYQYRFDVQQNISLLCGVVSVSCLLGWPILGVWLAREEGFYGLTTRRVLSVRRIRREIWVREAQDFRSVSCISNKDGQGTVSMLGRDGKVCFEFKYIKLASKIAALVAETFRISFDKVISNSSPAFSMRTKAIELLQFLYYPTSAHKGTSGMVSACLLWLAFQLFIWMWLGSISNIVGSSPLIFSVLILLSLWVTMGLLLRLKEKR